MKTIPEQNYPINFKMKRFEVRPLKLAIRNICSQIISNKIAPRLKGIVGLFFGLLLLTGEKSQGQVFTNIANVGDLSFSVEEGSTTLPYTQTTNSLSFNGSFSLGATLGGVWNPLVPKNWSLYDTQDFGLVLSVYGTNPSLSYSLELYDENLELVNTFIGSTFGANETPSFSPLTLSLVGNGDMSEVLGMQFTINSIDPINMEWSNVAVVPEPTTAFLLLLSLGLILTLGICKARRNTFTNNP